MNIVELLSKKKICLIDYEDNEIYINEINKLIKSKHNNIIMNKKIKESDIVIFISTSKEKFKHDYEIVKKEKKLMFIVLTETIGSHALFNEKLNVFHFIDKIQNFKETEAKRFQTFLSKALERKPEKVLIDFKFELKINYNNDSLRIDKFEKISTDKVLVKYRNGMKQIYNFKTQKLESQINPEREEYSCCCWAEFLNQLVCVQEIVSFNQPYIKIFDKTGAFIKKFKILYHMNYFVARSILCNEVQLEIYLHGFESSIGEKIWIYNKTFEVIKVVENYSIENLASFYSNVIDFNNCRYYVFNNNSQYVVLEQMQAKALHDILVFDTNSFSIIGFIRTRYRVKIVLNNKIILCDDGKGVYFVYKIEIAKGNFSILNNIDLKYICKSNQYLKSPHLYSNPYLLPCGNSVCLDCIHLNYNLHKSTIKCNFENCNAEHVLTEPLEKYTDMINLIKKNSNKLTESLIENEKIILNNLGITYFYVQTLKL